MHQHGQVTTTHKHLLLHAHGNVIYGFFFYSLNPQNGHQLPSVMVLCGPHLQGAYGVNCARQLSNHNVKVQVFMPGHAQIPAFMEDELKLFDSSDGKRTSSLQGIGNTIEPEHIIHAFIIFHIY